MFEQFQKNNLIFSEYFAHQKTSKISIFQKSYGRETFEKLGSLAMEICSIPSMFYITGVKAYNCLSISQSAI